MKFSITGDREELLACFGHADRFVGKSGALVGIHVVKDADGQRIEATDQRSAVRLYLSGTVDVDTLDTIIHPKLVRAIAACQSGAVTITGEEDKPKVTVKGKGRGVYQVPLIAGPFGDAFTRAAGIDWTTIIPVDANDSLDAMSRGARFVTKKDQGNPSITGINLRVVDEKLAIDATDGMRCYQEKVALPDKGFPFGEDEVILPVAMVNELKRLFPNGEIKFASDDAMFFATDPAGDTLFATRRISGKYPNMDAIAKADEYKVGFEVPRTEMLSALKRLDSLVGSKPALFEVSESEIHLTTTGEEGAAEEWVMLPNKADEVRLGFNVEYLLSAFDSFESDNVKLSYISPLRPVLFTADGEEKRFILSPVRMP